MELVIHIKSKCDHILVLNKSGTALNLIKFNLMHLIYTVGSTNLQAEKLSGKINKIMYIRRHYKKNG